MFGSGRRGRGGAGKGKIRSGRGREMGPVEEKKKEVDSQRKTGDV